MRWAAFVMGILGTLAAGGAGGLLLVGQRTAQATPQYKLAIELLRDPGTPQQVRATARAGLRRLLALPYFLLAAAPLGLLGALLARGRRGGAAAVLLLLAISGPVALAVGYALSLAEQAAGKARFSDTDTFVLNVLVAIPTFFLALAATFSFRLRPQADSDDVEGES